MTKDPHSWGKPLSALLGTIKMQVALGLPSIGGKDSMSGTFEHLNVPPTLVAFGITTVNANEVISPEFKKAGNKIYLIKHTPLDNFMPDTDALKANWTALRGQIVAGKVVSAWSACYGGVAEALVKMSFGNSLGVKVNIDEDELFRLNYGSVMVETIGELDIPSAVLLGEVTASDICINGETVDLDTLEAAYVNKYAKLYPPKVKPLFDEPVPEVAAREYDKSNLVYPGEPVAKPVVCLPVFPGSNCDYDTAKAFRKAGAEVRPFIFRNLTPEDVLTSIDELSARIDESHILAFCGGFSSGDEPDGSGKFIADVINNAKVGAAIAGLQARGGLIIGICNGFQALVKSGLLPYGKLGLVTPDSPTLFRNDINRHISLIAT
ncbi:MAG: phosphoribosylformylglycinamidine synthase subunit PurQ, partial [Clostridia bacterium]|nr:phosphoribosylformylglycinamidine synthase subunit PurQ [Clostridia bacterium]